MVRLEELVVIAAQQPSDPLGKLEVVMTESSKIPQARQFSTPDGELPALARSRPPVPGGGALARGSSFLAIFGAGSDEDVAVGADDFCGGALGEVVVNVAGGALKGKALGIGWSAASAGSAGGSGLGDPIALFGVGGGLGFGDAMGDVPVAVETFGSRGAGLG